MCPIPFEGEAMKNSPPDPGGEFLHTFGVRGMSLFRPDESSQQRDNPLAAKAAFPPFAKGEFHCTLLPETTKKG